MSLILLHLKSYLPTCTAAQPLPTCTAARNTYLHASFPPKRRKFTGLYGVTPPLHSLPNCTAAQGAYPPSSPYVNKLRQLLRLTVTQLYHSVRRHIAMYGVMGSLTSVSLRHLPSPVDKSHPSNLPVCTPLHCLPICTASRGAYPPPFPYATSSKSTTQTHIYQSVRRHKAIAHVHVI
jgi:hypothetical protein